MKVMLGKNSSIAFLLSFTLITLLSTLPLIIQTTPEKQVKKLPKHFMILKHWITSTSTIIGSDGRELGSMTQCSKGFNNNFRYREYDKQKVLTLLQKNRTLGSFDPLGISEYFGDQYDLLDKNNKPLNTIKRKVFESLFSWHPSYQIYSKKGNLLGQIHFVKHLMQKSIIVTSKKGNQVARLDKISSFLGLDSQWRATIKKMSKNIDRRLLIFLPGLYQSRKSSDLCSNNHN